MTPQKIGQIITITEKTHLVINKRKKQMILRITYDDYNEKIIGTQFRFI